MNDIYKDSKGLVVP